MTDAVRKYLSASPGADAAALLGLPPGQRHPGAVLQALQSQLQRVDNHPDHASAEAESVRARLYEAARVLLEGGNAAGSTAPRPAVAPAFSAGSWMQPAGTLTPQAATPQRPTLELAPPPGIPRRPIPAAPPDRLELTAFDRHVLAILVACGGWNAASRAKLVELAAEHHVAPQGLMKVVTGLCGHARLGAARFDVAQITQGARRFEQSPSAPPPAAAVTSDDIAESLLPELKEGGTWATVKLSLLFGAVTLLAGFLLLRVLIGEGNAARIPPIVHQPADDRPIDLGGNDADVEATAAPESALASWPDPPTFRGERSPALAADALDQSPRLPELLDELARKLSVADSPSAMSRQDWALFNEQASLIWVQGDRAIVRAVKANVFDVLFAIADRSAAAEEFIDALAAPAATLDDPLDVWRGAWSAGMLGEVAGRADLPAFLQQIAVAHVQRMLGDAEDSPPRTFTGTARLWLGQRIPRLVELAQVDPAAPEYWELWLEAQHALGRDGEYDAALVAAMGEVLRAPADLAQPGTLVNVLGRLIEEVDFADSPVVREEVLALFSDAAIDNRDLWVFTSLLVAERRAPWMTEELVVGPDASPELRRNAMMWMERSWPRPEAPVASASTGRGITIERGIGERWMTLARQQVAGLARLAQPVERQPRVLMQRIVLAAWLNEAALALAQGRSAEAEQALRLVESGWSSNLDDQIQNQPPMQIPRPGGGGNQPNLPNLPGTPPNPGAPGGPQPSNPGMPVNPGGVPANPGGTSPGGGAPSGLANGPDGMWAAAYNTAERNVDERMELLRSLRATAGADLGPIDARRLVEEAYRGPIPELRLFAQTILTELFTRGPNVARELVDQFVDAPAREITASFLRSYLSRSLPAPESSNWRRGARLALLEHALRLLPFADMEIDHLAEALAESYADGARLLHSATAGAGGGGAPLDSDAAATSWTQPADAIEAQVAEWRDLAARRMVSDPVPDPLPIIERRHATRRALAQGPIERALAGQITVFELLVYIAVAEQPVLAGEARSLLERAAMERIEAEHVLEQSLRTELAITQVWMLRLEVGDEEGLSDE